MPLVVVAAADVAIATKVGMREDALMGAADSLSPSLSLSLSLSLNVRGEKLQLPT